MNASEIQRMIKTDPNAEFAFRKRSHQVGEWKPTYVRGLTPSGTPGTWVYSETKGAAFGDDWVPAAKGRQFARSRDLVPGEQAREAAERTRAAADKRNDALRRAWTIADRLRSEHGIPARGSDGTRIYVDSDGFEALERLLDRLAGSGATEKQRQGGK